jgi:hypothetical protein
VLHQEGDEDGRGLGEGGGEEEGEEEGQGAARKTTAHVDFWMR